MHAFMHTPMHAFMHTPMHIPIHACFHARPISLSHPQENTRLETIEKALKTRLLIWLLRISEAIDLSQLFLFDRRRPVTSSATLPLLTYFCLSPFMFHNLVTFLSQTFFLFFYNFLSLIFSFFEFFSLFSCGI